MVEKTHIWACACLTLLWAVLTFASTANAQTTVIYQDDFEGAVSGWTDNSTDFAPAVTNFLGRFGDGQTTTSRTFTVPANSDELVIEFDFYRFDSWDNSAQNGFDRFELEINGTEIFSLPFPLPPQAARSGTAGNVDWSHSPLTGTEELGFNSGEFRFDQLHRFEVTVNNPSASVTLTLRADLNQERGDESAGYDNFLVTADPPTTGVGGSSFCPVGTNAIPGTYHVLSATGGNNPNRAVGAPLAEGSQDRGGNSGITFFPSVIYDLTNDPAILVPEGSVIQVSLAGNFNNSGSVAVSSALDNTNFPAAGSTGSQTFSFNNTNNTFEYFDYTVPAGGVRFMELDHLSGGIRFDGVVFDTICTLPPDVPIVAEDDSGSVADSSLGNTPVLNVLDNDTVDGATPTVFDLALAPGETLPRGLTFDTSTGVVEVLQDTLMGVYSFDYELCQAASATNCEIATVTITVTNRNPPSICPIGQTPSAGTFHVLSATGGNNPNRAVGAPLAEGSQDTGANSGITFFPSVIYDLTNDPDILVPEGSVIQVSLAGNFNDSGSVAVSSALDNTNFPASGSTGSQTFSFNNTNNTFEYFDYTVPAGGARFMELDHLSGGIRFDGVVFDTICTLPPDVTIVVEDDSGSVADSSLGNTPVLNVLDNDTFDGATPTVFDLALAPGETLPTGLTFDTSTGAVEVLQDTLTGVYNFDYQLCQAGSSTNCEIATITITVTNPNPPSICPVGSAPTGGIFHVVSATGGTNPNRAVGMPLAEGSQDTGANSGITFFPSVIYDLTNDPDILVPEGSVIEVSLAGNFNDSGSVAVSSALDNTNFPASGSTGSETFSFNNTNNIFEYFDYTVPAGGARYIELDHLSGGVRFDGVIYNTQCQESAAPATSLTASKSVTVYDPTGAGLYALPGNDVIYTISIDNPGTGDVDSGSLVLIDSMPGEVNFFNGDIDDGGPETDPIIFQDTGGGLTFDINTDVGYSNAAAKPANFADCTYVPAAGYDPNVIFICFNPKGVMQAQSSWSVSFRTLIE